MEGNHLEASSIWKPLARTAAEYLAKIIQYNKRSMLNMIKYLQSVLLRLQYFEMEIK